MLFKNIDECVNEYRETYDNSRKNYQGYMDDFFKFYSIDFAKAIMKDLPKETAIEIAGVILGFYKK